MKVSILIRVILLLVFWSCKGERKQSVQLVNDTTFLLNQALHDAVSVRFMPGAGAAVRPYIFKDSILLTSNVISLNLLPTSIDDHNFKIMAEYDILRILKADSNNFEQPNYLILSRFEANDSGYYVQVQSLSAMPYGSGGSLGMYYIKEGDSLVNVKRSASSIN